jgi:hypothetical protein
MLALGEDHGGLNGCVEGQSLAVGAQCTIQVSWTPRNRSTSGLDATVEIRIWNTMTTITSVPVSASYSTRVWMSGGMPVLDARRGYKQREKATIHNVGDSAAEPSVRFTGEDAQFFAVDSNRQNTCAGNTLPVDSSCEIPVVFCAGVERTYGANMVITANGNDTETVPVRSVVEEVEDPPLCTGLQVND